MKYGKISELEDGETMNDDKRDTYTDPKTLEVLTMDVL
jgi:hypothetical protein